MHQKPFLLAAEDLIRSLDGFKDINDLNFYLDEGELRTVIGPQSCLTDREIYFARNPP